MDDEMRVAFQDLQDLIGRLDRLLAVRSRLENRTAEASVVQMLLRLDQAVEHMEHNVRLARTRVGLSAYRVLLPGQFGGAE